tara:strand:- start:214 stop:1275 length:1062 start_codon:yes stop_codon:yes gene_type:complete
MLAYIQSYIKSFKYIKALVQFKEEKIDQLEYTDELYLGLDHADTKLRVFYSKKENSQSIIIFPGASPYAEEHPGMIMLGNALKNAGYNVFLPRIPNLKNLILKKENVDWFVHCYNELLKHPSITNNVMVVGLSYGGANLLKASIDERMQSHPPKSILSYGTYFSIETALDFFLTGKILYNNKTYSIAPHEWGMIVMFYNFFNSIDTNHDYKNITLLLKNRIEDKNTQVEKIKKTLNLNDQNLVDKILSGKTDEYIKTLVDQMIVKNSELLEYLSPKNWARNVITKTFVIHGANDSMVPFTESTLLAKNIKNSELLISFLYEHREISSDHGIFFKIKEVCKMIIFFAYYFRYNK